MASRTIAAISDKPLRERALSVVREMHPDWPKVYSEVFFLDEEPRILSLIVDALEEGGHTELRDRLIDETLRYPRRHPRAFYWFVKQLNERRDADGRRRTTRCSSRSSTPSTPTSSPRCARG